MARRALFLHHFPCLLRRGISRLNAVSAIFAFHFHKGVHQLIMLLDFSNRLPQLIAPLRFGMQRAEYG